MRKRKEKEPVQWEVSKGERESRWKWGRRRGGGGRRRENWGKRKRRKRRTNDGGGTMGGWHGGGPHRRGWSPASMKILPVNSVLLRLPDFLYCVKILQNKLAWWSTRFLTIFNLSVVWSGEFGVCFQFLALYILFCYHVCFAMPFFSPEIWVRRTCELKVANCGPLIAEHIKVIGYWVVDLCHGWPFVKMAMRLVEPRHGTPFDPSWK